MSGGIRRRWERRTFGPDVGCVEGPAILGAPAVSSSSGDDASGGDNCGEVPVLPALDSASCQLRRSKACRSTGACRDDREAATRAGRAATSGRG